MLHLRDPWTAPDSLQEDQRVGIVMRTKNRPLFLARSLASVINQTYSNFSLVVVNDGGDYEACEEVLRDYRGLYGPRLKVVHNEQSVGMEAASNAGLEALSEVAFFAIHDDDDTWHRDFLLRSVSFLNSEDGQAYGAVASRVDVIEEVVDHDRVRVVGQYPYDPWREPLDILSYLMVNSFPPICLLTRWSLLDRTGEFDSRMPVLGEWDFGIRLLMQTDIATLAETLAYHHLRPEGSGIFGNAVRERPSEYRLERALFLNRTWRACLDRSPEAYWLTLASAQFARALFDRLNEMSHGLAPPQPDYQSQTAAALDRLESAVRHLDARMGSATTDNGGGAKGSRRLLDSVRRRFTRRGPAKQGHRRLEQSTDQISLVDPEWYLRAYPDVAASGIDPEEHYARWGIQEGRSPGPK